MKRRRKILIVIGVLFAAVILIPVIHHYQLRAAVESYIAELKAKGEPMELVQVLPPTLPPEQNGAEIFRKAAALLDADEGLLATNSFTGLKMVAPGKAMIRWQQPDVRDYDETNSWEELGAAVAQNKETMELLRQITDRPAFDFRFPYERGFVDVPFTNLFLPELKRAAQRVSAAVMFDLRRGDVDSAVKNERAMLAIVKAAQSERLVISELVRTAVANIALAANWEILQAPNLTDEHLAVLQQDWMSLDFIRSAENALAMERAVGLITLAKQRKSNSELQREIDMRKQALETLGLAETKETFFGKAKTKVKIFAWRYWWSYPDELRWLKGYQILMTTTRLVQTNGSFYSALQHQATRLDELGVAKLNDELDSLFSGDMNFHSMLSESIVTIATAVRRVMRIETAKKVIVVAIALKRHQLKYGNYPAGLPELTPEFLSAIPGDPVDGQPLRYRRNEDRTFLLYSIGENGSDDGGDASQEGDIKFTSPDWQHARALDWVWPQPATHEEIQKFYEERAKKSK